MNGSIPIKLAVEDSLSEHILRRVLADRQVHYEVAAVHQKRGFGYLRSQTASFNNAAKAQPFLLLTDLDQVSCPAELIASWLGATIQHQRFLLRVAVRAVESWLLGDIANLRSFLGVRTQSRIDAPEEERDPKQTLLSLAVAGRVRRIREAIVWRDENGRLRQGPAYNDTLAEFVGSRWDAAASRRSCQSLDRLCRALDRLESTYR
jgi:hypothetical protein